MACKGSDRRLVDYIISTWEAVVCKIHGKEIIFNIDIITEAMRLPTRGREVH